MALHDDLRLIAESDVVTAYQVPDPNLKQVGPIGRYVKSGVSYHRSTGMFVIGRPDGDVQARSQHEAVSLLTQAWMGELSQLQQSDESTYKRAVVAIEGPYVYLARSHLGQ